MTGVVLSCLVKPKACGSAELANKLQSDRSTIVNIIENGARDILTLEMSELLLLLLFLLSKKQSPTLVSRVWLILPV